MADSLLADILDQMRMADVIALNQSKALALAERGFAVFPCGPDKRPLTTNGFKNASDDPAKIEAWWDQHPAALIGMALPADTMAVDVDSYKPEYQPDHGLDLPDAPSQTTMHGGRQYFYRTDGRPVAQQTNVRPAIDTRVAGRGYVIAYEPERILSAVSWPTAPAWAYEAPTRPTAAPGDAPAVMGTRDAILRWLGGIAVHSKLTAADYLGMLTKAVADGRIVARDPKDPWTGADLDKLADEAAKWETTPDLSGVVDDLIKATGKAKAETGWTTPDPAITSDLGRMRASDLLKLDLPVPREAFAGLLTAGLGLLAGAPKVGKSLLAYQFGIELTLGGLVLGRKGEIRPVLYYALEDGRRRSQDRIKAILAGRKLPADGFEVQWTAPRLGGPLEAEVSAWLDQHEAGVVIIDVLAKVRPDASKRGQSAYDEDYTALDGMQVVAKLHPGSVILFVTHDRKAGSEDWVTRITGTRGLSGLADVLIFIHRDRGKPTAKITMTGRDMADDLINATFTGSLWLPADASDLIGAKSPTRQAIFAYVKANGPVYQKAIAEATGLDVDVVYHRVSDMAKDGQLVSVPEGYIVAED